MILIAIIAIIGIYLVVYSVATVANKEYIKSLDEDEEEEKD